MVRPVTSESTDRDAEVRLLHRVARGDRGAFSELFDRYHPRLFKFLFRLTSSYSTADELTNDVLLAVWQSAAKFRGDARVSTWIFGIAYRQALRRLRARRLRLLPISDSDSPVDSGQHAIENEDWVRAAIRELPPKQQLTLLLVYYVGLTCEETARATDVPVNTVKTRMFHARRKLKSHLSSATEGNDD